MRTILLVDDQPSVVATLTYVFMSHGYAVLSASKGGDALALAETQAFDVALIDLHMPVVDGATVCRKLCERARNTGKNLPIWIMTAAHSTEAAKVAVEAGARCLLKKPFDCAQLLVEIDVALGQSAPLPADHIPAPNATVAVFPSQEAVA